MQPEKYIDLHMHSTFSDGVMTPRELVETAGRKGLSAISLSDHDSLDGFPELSAAAAEAGLEVISGVEMSCEHNGRDLHVLAYGVSVEDDNLQRLLRLFCEVREERGIRIVEKLAGIGVEIDMKDVLAKAGDGALGRPHIAEVLLEKGHVSEFGEAFVKYIGEDCPAYVGKYKMSPGDAVMNIHKAGGLAFVAHPGYYLEDPAVFDDILDEGFDGIEVHHPHHNGNTVKHLLNIATRRELLVSGGSDFHGFAGRDNMGEPRVSYNLLTLIKERIA